MGKIYTADNFVKSSGTSSQFLKADGSVDSTTYQTALTNPITGTGTTNYLPKFTGASAIGNSLIYDNGTNVGIGTTSPVDKLDVNGIFRSIVTSISSTGEIAAKILGYPTSPFGLIFRSYSSGATSIQSQREASNSELFPLLLQPLGGNVGIGTTSPASKLTVNADANSNANAITIYSNNTTAQSYTSIGSYYANGNTNVNSQIRFGNENTNGGEAYLALATGSGSATERMRITSGGNVGIGTSSPVTKLHVDKTSQTIGGSTPNGGLVITNLAGSNYALEFGTDTSLSPWIQSRNAASASYYNLLLNPSGGNVGIGTTSPTHLLSVENSSSYETASFKSSSVPYQIIGNAAVGDYWRGFFTGQNIVTNATTGKPSVKVSGYTASAIAYSADSSQGYLGFFTTSSTTANTDLSERMRITSGGNVGIGTTSPNEKLQVLGNIRLTNNNLTTANTLSSEINNYNGSTNQFKSSSIKFLTGTYVDQGHITFNTSISGVDQERVRIAETGNVGIGTTSPGGKLHVVGEGIFDDGTNGRLTFANASSQNDIYSTTTSFGGWKNLRLSSNELILSSGGTTERMRITSGGNVGIGTTSPVTKLHVQNGTTANTTLMIQSWGTEAGGEFAGIRFKSATTANNEYGKGFIGFRNNATGYGRGDLYFCTNNLTDTSNAGLTDSKMVITSGGNVGIGTTSPAEKLDVAGNGSFGISGGINNSKVAVLDASIITKLQSQSAGDSAGVVGTESNNDFKIITNNTERMRITSGGNVLIGTTTDAGYKLDVNGTGRFSGVTTLKTGISPFYAARVLNYNGVTTDRQLFLGVIDDTYQTVGNSYYYNSGFFRSTTTTGSFIDFSGGRFRVFANSGLTADTDYAPTVRLTIDTAGAATFSSTVTATGFFNSSDNRLKDLTDYDYNVSDIKPITYLWKDGRDNKKHVGYSAQEVQKVMPDAVNEDSDGMLSVNYVEILVAKISQMEKEIAYLKSKI